MLGQEESRLNGQREQQAIQGGDRDPMASQLGKKLWGLEVIVERKKLEK